MISKLRSDNEIELNSIIDLEVQGIITRSRAQWTQEGERSTNYFFGLEKSNGKKKSISKLITPEKKIIDHIVNFYQTLYTSNNPSATGIESYIDNSQLTS